MRAAVGRCRLAFRKLEGDPATQYKIHRFMGRLWVIMTPVAIAVCIFWPGVWLKVSIIYVVIISHYANWSTDSGAMAAANASTDEVITAYEAGAEDCAEGAGRVDDPPDPSLASGPHGND